MIAAPVPYRLALGIVAAVLFGLLAAQPYRPVGRQEPMSEAEGIDVARLRRELDEHRDEIHVQIRPTVCDRPNVTTIVIRGRATNQGHFAIQIPGVRHVYSAITDEHGTFELRIPRDDFDDDLCNVPEGRSFADSEMSLSYHYDVE